MSKVNFPSPVKDDIKPITDKELNNIFRYKIYWDLSPYDITALIERLRQSEAKLPAKDRTYV